MKNFLQIILPSLICILIFAFVIDAQVASNPPYTLDQAVIGSGGGASSGGAFSLNGTIGQSIAGQKTNASPFSVYAGFWTPGILAPTASSVTVSGRVTNSIGRGIRNVLIIMINSSGIERVAASTTFGYFSFQEVAAGETYIFTARGKRFTFSRNTQARSITEDTTDINFVANQ